MRTTDLFKVNRSSQRLNESIKRVFGKKLNLESFDLPKLEDARNKLRTQISQLRSASGFNENLENDSYHQAQWMLDAINAEIAEREEFIADAGAAEASYEEGADSAAEKELYRLGRDADFDDLYDASGREDAVGHKIQQLINDISGETGLHPDDDIEEILYRVADHLEDEYGHHGDEDNDTGGDTDDNYALASAGFGSDEDYESIDQGDGMQEGYRVVAVSAKTGEPFKSGVYKTKEQALGMNYKMAKSRQWRDIDIVEVPKSDVDEGIQGDNMHNVTEGEIQQASAIVSAKTMVDRVGRWIEELSGMENDTLLQLGDQIRDEMGAEQAKGYISSVAPAIQAALENLKQTRETLATGVRQLTGEEQGAEMLGAEPEGEMEPTAPDEMNMPAAEPEAPAADEFAAAEPAAGGLGDAGREKRESIEYQNKLLKVLVG